MQILRLHIENFGKLHDFDIDFHSGLHVICTENGWGKSTLAAFIKAMFYGLPCTTKRSLAENDRKHYQPWQGGAFGGSMEFLAEGKTYRAERFFGKKDKEDRFALYNLETGLACKDFSANLGEEMFHVDRAAYERSSFFIQQDFSVSINDSLNARLTHTEEGVGDIRNYEQAMISLEEQMKYYRKTGNRGEIGKLEEQRRTVRGELSQCREQEEEMKKWNEQLMFQKQRVKEAASAVEDAEEKIRLAHERKQLQSKKEQYELLKSQAGEKQEELQKTAVALAGYSTIPPKEKELDRAREWIYQLDILRQKETEAQRQVQDAVSYLGNMEDAKDEHTSSGMIYGILAGFFVIIGVFFLFQKMIAVGILCLVISAAALLAGVVKSRRANEQKDYLEHRIQEGRQRVRETEKVLRDIQKKQENLEKKISEFLSLPKRTDCAEMERVWKEMRQKSREYRDLKQKYELQRQEVSRSRELWFRYGENFPKEERKLLSGDALTDIQMLKDELKNSRFRLEHQHKVQNDIQYRIAGLRRKTERIPELEEQEGRLSEKISEALQEYDLLDRTAEYLKLAKDQFSARYLKQLQEKMKDYLRVFSSGWEMDLTVDVSLQLKVQQAGAFRDLEYQSTGQRDLLHFAERLAILDVLYQKETSPLILDDPFVNMDTEKQRWAMEILKNLSKERQMIYFTCHDFIKDAAV